MISVGLVGCGRNSDNHLRVYSRSDVGELAALCDIDEGLARSKAERYGVDKAFSGFDRMLRLDLDLVDVVTPVDTHADLATRALEAGCNVLVEKPMALTSEECREMVDAAEESGRKLSVVHNKRFFSSVRRLESILEEEELEVTRVRVSQYHAYLDDMPAWAFQEDRGGLLWESLTHHVYLILRFLPDADSVYATSREGGGFGDYSVSMILEGDGRTGVGEFEADVRVPLETIEVSTRGGARFVGDLQVDHLRRRDSDYRDARSPALRSLPGDVYEPMAKGFTYVRDLAGLNEYGTRVNAFTKSFFGVIGEMLEALSDPEVDVPVPPEEGLRVIETLEATKRSIETGNIQEF